jgi:hypothetical protein
VSCILHHKQLNGDLYGLRSRQPYLCFQYFPLHHIERVALGRQAAVHRLQRRHIRIHEVRLRGTSTPKNIYKAELQSQVGQPADMSMVSPVSR